MRIGIGLMVLALFATSCGNDYSDSKGAALSAAMPMNVCATDCRECHTLYACGTGWCCGEFGEVQRIREGETDWECQDAATLFRIRNTGSRCWVSTIY
jgi:hypothetical protein